MVEKSLYFERKESPEELTKLKDVIDFAKKLILDEDLWVEKKGNKLIIAGAMSFIRKIVLERERLLDAMRKNPYFENVHFVNDGPLVINANLKSPIGEINQIEIRIDKD
ncbi:MAG: hypothetical protein WA019_03630, partial [Candidatus Moraniibacteriota bacterium]